MQLLLLTPQLPYPLHQGTTIRNFHILQHLAARHEITLLTFATPAELEAAAPVRALCKEIAIAPYPARSPLARARDTFLSPLPDMALRLQSSTLRAKLRELLEREQFDLVQVEGIEMASAWMFEVRNWKLESSHGIQPPTSNLQPLISNLQSPISIFDDHNAEYTLQRTAFESDARDPRRWHAALYSWIQWQKLARYERSVCATADRVIACSESDANALRALSQYAIRNTQHAFTVVPNGVDTQYYVPSDAVCAKPLAEFALVFTGKMDYRPNIDAMIWFCQKILPRVRAVIPYAHIVIVGQKPASKILALRTLPGVEITGAVPDTRPFIADAALYVMPLRMGSGTRLKALEAMAMGKAIVSTARGVEGLEIIPDRDAVIADSPDNFARAVIALLRDPDRRHTLGAAARKIAEEQYDWRVILPRLDALYDAARADWRAAATRL